MTNEDLHISKDGLDFIRREEGCVLHIYLDFAKPPKKTVGVGHLLLQSEIDSHIYDNGITLNQALQILAKDVVRFENAIKQYITLELSQPKFDSLLSLAFNCGTGPLIGGLGKALNNNDMEAVHTEWVKWCKAGGGVNKLLLARRIRELEMFFKDDHSQELTDDEKQQILNSVNLSITSNLDDLYDIDMKDGDNT